MHVDSFHGAQEPKDCQVLQSPCSLPLPQGAQKPSALPDLPRSPPPHLLSPDPSSFSTTPSFLAEGTLALFVRCCPCYPLKISIALRSLAQEHRGQPGVGKELWNTTLLEPPSSLLHQLSEQGMPESAGRDEQRCIPSPHPSTPPDVPSNTVLGSRP